MLTDRRRTDAGVIGILIAHLGIFGSGELISRGEQQMTKVVTDRKRLSNPPPQPSGVSFTWHQSLIAYGFVGENKSSNDF